MRVILLIIATIAIYGAWSWYPRDEPPDVNPGLRDLKINASHIDAATTSFLGTERPVLSVSIEQSGSGTRTWVTADNGATLENIYAGADKVYVQGPVSTSSKGVTAAQTMTGGKYIGDESKGQTYASIFIPPMVLSDDEPGSTIPDSAHIKVEVYAYLPNWESFTWSGGVPPESWDDVSPSGKGNAMLWTEYTDDNGAIPGLELNGVDLQKRQSNDNSLFASGIAAGLAAAALIAIFTESSAIYRDNKAARLKAQAISLRPLPTGRQQYPPAPPQPGPFTERRP